MKRIYLKKNGQFFPFTAVTGLNHPTDESTFKIAALAAFEIDPDLEGFDIREGVEVEQVSPFGESKLQLTVNGFAEYGRIRFGLTEGQAEEIRKVIVEAKKGGGGREGEETEESRENAHQRTR